MKLILKDRRGEIARLNKQKNLSGNAAESKDEVASSG